MWCNDEALDGQNLTNNIEKEKQPLNIDEVLLVFLLNTYAVIPCVAASFPLQCMDFLAENLIYSSPILFAKYHSALLRKKWNDMWCFLYSLYYQPVITPEAEMLAYKNAMLYGYERGTLKNSLSRLYAFTNAHPSIISKSASTSCG